MSDTEQIGNVGMISSSHGEHSQSSSRLTRQRCRACPHNASIRGLGSVPTKKLGATDGGWRRPRLRSICQSYSLSEGLHKESSVDELITYFFKRPRMVLTLLSPELPVSGTTAGADGCVPKEQEKDNEQVNKPVGPCYPPYN